MNQLLSKSSNKPSLATITRADITRLCERYKHNKPRLRLLLLAIFARRENIHLFAWFVSPKYHPLETPAFHKEILSDVSDKSKPFVAVAAPRGHAKSTLVNHDFLLWAICTRQVHFAIPISDTYSQSVEFVNAVKEELADNTIIRWLYGDLSSNYWRDGEFVTSTGIKVLALGSGMKIRGLRHREHRPDLLIFDDLENDEQVASAEQRKKLKRWFIKAALNALSRDGRAIIIGTILHHDSLLNNIIRHQEMFAAWLTRLYRALNTDSKGREYALWPQHENVDYLKAIRDDPKHPKYMGSIAFAQERQNKPFSEEDAIIQPDWIQWALERPPENAVLARAEAVDPATSEKQRADPTGIVVGELDNSGDAYIFYASDKRLTPRKNAEEIKRVYETYEPNAVGVEAGALEIVFSDLLDGVATIPQKPDKDKVRRLLAVSKFFEGGKIYFVQKGRGIQSLYDQLMEFPAGTHDDMVDAMVYVIRMLLVDGFGSEDEVETAGNYNRGNPEHEDDDPEDEEDSDW